MTLNELKADLLADGIIDADEVARLKEVLYEDGVIDKEEADFLFEINDAVTGKDNDPAWEAFFIQAIADFLLKDEVSPGELIADCFGLFLGGDTEGQVDDWVAVGTYLTAHRIFLIRCFIVICKN